MSNPASILTSSDLAVGYKGKTVLSALNLDLSVGQLTCLLGPNGSGKSTLIRTLSGIQKPLSGSVTLEGRLIGHISQKERAQKLSLVLTDRLAPGNLTAYALVSLGRFPYTSWMGSLNDSDKQLIQWAMEVTDTVRFANRHVGELSDGEKQKVMIARALVQDTDIIILDEPTAHLDSPNRIEIFHLLRQLSLEAGKTILVSTHEIDMAIEHGNDMWLVMPDQHIKRGVPEDLILSGAMEKAFGSHSLVFDHQKGRFRKSKHTTEGHEIIGDPIHVKWTQSALERLTVSKALKIEIQTETKQPVWILDGHDVAFDSIESLIKHLKNH